MELYVGNLPWSTNDQSLTQLFAAHGAVQRAKVVLDRDTGRSRGFAFVTMDDAAAQAAINALNGTQIEGRAITVRRAEERKPGQGGGQGGPRRSGGGGYGGGGGQGGYGGDRPRY